MIYDCFTFYNELDLLEIRLNILDGVIDKFVLIESNRTYTNLKKPLYYFNNRTRYKKFEKKIIHIVVKDSPNVSHPWIIEHFLMAAAKRGLKNAKPKDTILISNLDEIPRPEKIKDYLKKPGKLKVFQQQFFYYFLNFISTNRKWLGTKMLRYEDFLKYQDAYVIRHSPNNVTIPDGGWHFSYMGGIKKIQEKLATGSHQEFNNENYNTKEKILIGILNKQDIFGHGDKFDFIPIENLPLFIRKNQRKYKNLFIKPKNEKLISIKLLLLEKKHKLRVLYRAIRESFTV